MLFMNNKAIKFYDLNINRRKKDRVILINNYKYGSC